MYWLLGIPIAVFLAVATVIAIRRGAPGGESSGSHADSQELPLKKVEELAHELRMRIDVIYLGMAQAKPPVARPYSHYDTLKVARLLQKCLIELRGSIDSYKSRHAEVLGASTKDTSAALQKAEYLHDFSQQMVCRLIYFALEGKAAKNKAA